MNQLFSVAVHYFLFTFSLYLSTSFYDIIKLGFMFFELHA